MINKFAKEILTPFLIWRLISEVRYNVLSLIIRQHFKELQHSTSMNSIEVTELHTDDGWTYLGDLDDLP